MMSFKLSGSSLFVLVTGVKGVEITDINETLKRLDQLSDGTRYQVFDADRIAGINHIAHAANNAYYAMENELNISNNLSIETLLYAACETQIKAAINLLGVTPSTRNVALAVFSETKDDPVVGLISDTLGAADDSVLDINPEKYIALKELFGVTETAIESVGKEPPEALAWLITEKGALIGLRR